VQISANIEPPERVAYQAATESHRYRHPKGPTRRILRLWGPSSFTGYCHRLSVSTPIIGAAWGEGNGSGGSSVDSVT
jgi:hypothetical protein